MSRIVDRSLNTKKIRIWSATCFHITQKYDFSYSSLLFSRCRLWVRWLICLDRLRIQIVPGLGYLIFFTLFSKTLIAPPHFLSVIMEYARHLNVQFLRGNFYEISTVCMNLHVIAHVVKFNGGWRQRGRHSAIIDILLEDKIKCQINVRYTSG